MQVYSPSGTLQRSFGGTSLTNPYGICTNDPYSPATEGAVVVDVCKVFVCDRSAKAVLVFRASGSFEGYVGSGVLEAPYGVTYDAADGKPCGETDACLDDRSWMDTFAAIQ